MVEALRRAAPLPPEERREAILVATVPLLRELGLDVTTRQIAQAAGVAEGTLFRVFPDKESLIRAAVAHALAPTSLLQDLQTVSPALPLEERLLMITTMLQGRLRSVIELMTAVRMRRPPEDEQQPGGVPPAPRHAAFLDAIADLLEPDREALTMPPREVARMLRLITFAGTHTGIADGDPLTPAEIVSVLLNGVRRNDTG
jgi:AcrR family transcriptional regulator